MFREKSRCLCFAVKIISQVKWYAIFQVPYFGRITPCAYTSFCRKWIFENQKREGCTCTTHHEWFLARWDYKCLPRRPSIFFEALPIKVWFSAPFPLFQSCNGKSIGGGQEKHGQSVCLHGRVFRVEYRSLSVFFRLDKRMSRDCSGTPLRH